MALVVGMILITAIVLGAMAFAPVENFSRESDWSYENDDAIEKLTLVVEAEVCEVEVSFNDLDGKLVDVSIDVDGRSGYLGGEPDISYGVETHRDGKNITVTVTLDMETGPTIAYDDSNIVVRIDRSVPTFLDLDVDVGDVVVRVPGNASLTGAAMHTDVGGLRMNLEEGSMVLGDLLFLADVGSVNLDSANANFADGIVVSAETGTGSVYLDVEQTMVSTGNFTIDCHADVGSVYLTLMVEGDVSAEITSQANVGDIETDLAGFSGMDVHLVSDNHPDIRSIESFLEADVGSVYIDAEWGD